MVEKKIDIQISAEDLASEVLDQVGKSSKRAGEDGKKGASVLSRAWDQAAKAIVVANQGIELAKKALSGLRAITIGPATALLNLSDKVRESTEEFRSQERTLVQTAVALRNVGQLTKDNVTRVEDFANAVEESTGVGNELVLQLTAMATAVLGFGQNTERAVKAAIDLAAQGSVGLTESIKAITRATQTGSFELAGFGTIQLKAADSAGRLAEVLSIVEARYGGVAAAIKEADFSFLTDVEREFTNVKKALQEIFLNTPEVAGFFRALENQLKGVTTFLQANFKEAITLSSALFITFVETGVNAAKRLEIALKLLGNNAEQIFNFLTAVGIIRDPIGEATDQIRDALEDLNDAVEETGGDYRDSIKKIQQEIEQAISQDLLDPNQLKELEDKVLDISNRLILRSLRTEGFSVPPPGVPETGLFAPEFDESADLGRRAREGLAGLTQEQRQGVFDTSRELFDFDQLEELRQGLNQLRTEAEKPYELSVDAARLQGEMAEVLDRFSGLLDSFNIGPESFVQDFFEETQKAAAELEKGTNTDRVIEGLMEAGEAADALGSKTSQAGTNAAGAFREAGGAANELGQQAGETADSAATAIDGVGQAASRAGNEAGVGFNAVADAMDTIVEKGNSISNLQLDVFQELVNSADEVETLGSGLDRLEQALKDAETVGLISGDAVAQGMKEIEQAASGAKDEIENVNRELQSTSSGIGGNTTVKVSAEVVGAADISDALDEGNRDLQSSGRQLDQAARSQTNAVSVFLRAGETLARAGSELITAASRIENSLGSASRELGRAASSLNSAAQGLGTVEVKVDVSGGGGASAGSQGLAGRVADNTNAIAALRSRVEDLEQRRTQHGGIAMSQQVRSVAEAGPELILPLNSQGEAFLTRFFGGPRGGGGGGGVHLTITGNTIIADDLDQFARELQEKIVTQMIDSQEARI